MLGKRRRTRVRADRLHSFSRLEPRWLLTTLLSGQEVESAIVQGSTDSFEFQVDENERVDLSVGRISGGTPRLTILGPDGTEIPTNDTFVSAHANFVAPQEGIYTASVQEEGGDSDLSFRIRALSLPDAPEFIAGRDQVIQNGEEFESEVPLGSFNIHQLQVSAGSIVDVSAGYRGFSSFNLPTLKLTLISPDGSELETGVDGSSANLTFNAVLDGIYTVIVDEEGRDRMLPYRIRALTNPSTPQLIDGRDSELASGQETFANVPQGVFNIHQLQLNAGEQVRIVVGIASVSGFNSASIKVSVFDPTGIEVAEFAGNSGVPPEFSASESGSYTLVIEDEGRDAAFSYRVRALIQFRSLQLSDGRDQVLVNGHELIASVPTGGVNLYPMDLSSGDVVLTSVGKVSGGRPKLTILSPSGIELDTDVGSQDARLTFTATETGRYIAIVEEDGMDVSLGFQIRSAILFGEPQLIAERDVRLENGEEAIVSVPAGGFNIHRLDASAGDLVDVSAGRVSGFTGNFTGGVMLLTVFGPDGEEIGFDIRDTDAHLTFVATLDGTYTAVIEQQSSGNTSSYRIRALTLPSSPQLINGRDQPLENGEEFIGEVPVGGINFYPLEVASEETVHISAGLAGSGTPTVRVIGPSGAIIDNILDDSRRFEFTATSSGTYYAVVEEQNRDDLLNFRIRTFIMPGSPQLIADRDRPLQNGEEFVGTIPSNGFNLHSVQSVAGETLLISVGRVSGVISKLTIYSPTGEKIGDYAGTGIVPLEFVASQTGSYIVVVEGSRTQYRIRSLAGAEFPLLVADREHELQSGEEIESNVPSGGFNIYPIHLDAGATLDISAGRVTGFVEPKLSLYGPGGTELVSDVAHTLNYVATEGGAYFVTVQEVGLRDFRLRTLISTVPPTLIPDRDQVLQNGDEVFRDTPRGSFNLHPFEVRSGQTIDVTAVRSSNGPVELTILGPDGNVVATDIGDEAQIEFTASQTGVFTTIVAGWETRQSLSYAIRMLELPDPTVSRDRTVENGEEVISRVPVGEANSYMFYLEQGEDVEVLVGRIGASAITGSPKLTVYAPNGRLVDSHEDANTARLNFVANRNGFYTATFEAIEADRSLDFRFRAITFSRAPELIPGRESFLQNGEEAVVAVPRGSVGILPFSASAGESLYLTTHHVISLAAFAMTVYAPDGTEVAATSQHGLRRLDFVATQTGVYSIVVGTADRSQSISYRIRAIAVPRETVLIEGRDQALGNGEEFLASVPTGSFNVYTFQADSGGLVDFSTGIIDGTSESFGNPRITIFSPDGAIVERNSPGSLTFQARISFVATQSGSYTAIVEDDGNDRPIDFRVRVFVSGHRPQLVEGRDQVLRNGEETVATIPTGTFSIHPVEIASIQNVFISVGNLNGYRSPRITVFAPNGEVIGADSSELDAQLEFSADQQGEYVILVENDSRRSSILDYRIRVLARPETPELIPGRDRTLQNGEPIVANIPQGGFNIYHFDVLNGAEVAASVDVGERAMTSVTIFSPTGLVIGTNADDPVARLNFTASETGTYTLIVRNESNPNLLPDPNLQVQVTGISQLPPSVIRFSRDGHREGQELLLDRPDRLDLIDISFNQDVDAAYEDFTFFNETTGASVLIPTQAFSYDVTTFTASWDFSGFLPPLFPPGLYSISANASDITATSDGRPLPEDFSQQVLVALPGDANLDGKVDVLGDAFALVGNLGTTSGATWQQGDFNGDGMVDVLNDAFALVGNLGQNLIPAGSSLSKTPALASTPMPAAPKAVVIFETDSEEDDKPQTFVSPLDAVFADDEEILVLA